MIASGSRAASASPVRRIRDLPGPPGLPLLGSALQIRKDQLHLQAERWNRRYGSIYRLRIALQEFVVLSDPELVAGVLRDRPDGFNRPARLDQVARQSGLGGLFSSNGDTWRRQRPMVLHGLDPSHVKDFFPTLVKVTERFARRWQRAAAAGEAIDLQQDLMRYTVDVTAGLALGADINTIESGHNSIQSHLDKVLPGLYRRLMAPFPYWDFVKLPSDLRIERHLKQLKVSMDVFIRAARRRLDECPRLREEPSNLIEAMIAARDRDDSFLTDEDVSGNVLTMLLAGEDTTANTLAWTIWFLHHNRDALRRASSQVRAVVGTDAQLTRHPQLSELDFVEACANESMRLKPVAPLIIVQAARDTVVGGVALPRGTLVMCLTRVPAVDPRRFPDPHAFRPERWLSAEGAMQAPSSPKRVTMPFGAGPRICPGRYLALAEMKMLLAMLLGGFEIQEVSTPDGGEAQEIMAFTMSPVGLKLRLRALVNAGPVPPARVSILREH